MKRRSVEELQPCLGQGAALGEEAVLTDSGRAGEVTARDWLGKKAEHFEHPVGFSFVVCHYSFPETG